MSGGLKDKLQVEESHMMDFERIDSPIGILVVGGGISGYNSRS